MPEGTPHTSPIRPEIQRMLEWERAFKRLENLGDVWIGPDITLEKKMLTQPGLLMPANILISKEDLPPVVLDRGVLGSLQWSVRSFLAQAGIEITVHHGDLSDEMIQELNNGGKVAFPVRVMNYAQRPIELEGKVMRFFWANDRNRLRGEKLRKVVGTELKIEGEEGKDWYFGDAEPMEGEPKPTDDPNVEWKKDLCVILPLTDKRLYLPGSEEPLRVKSKAELANFLQPVPEGIRLPFEIGETTQVHLGDNITAVINTGFYDEGGRHIRSPLIDSGYSGVIRTETVNDMSYIELFVYKNK